VLDAEAPAVKVAVGLTEMLLLLLSVVEEVMLGVPEQV